MIDAPAIVIQQQQGSREEVLQVYARYYYGNERYIAHHFEQLEQLSDQARTFGLMNISEFLLNLADQAWLQEVEEQTKADAEYEDHIRHLRHDYR